MQLQAPLFNDQESIDGAEQLRVTDLLESLNSRRRLNPNSVLQGKCSNQSDTMTQLLKLIRYHDLIAQTNHTITQLYKPITQLYKPINQLYKSDTMTKLLQPIRYHDLIAQTN